MMMMRCAYVCCTGDAARSGSNVARKKTTERGEKTQEDSVIFTSRLEQSVGKESFCQISRTTTLSSLSQ
jgi:hypothetical protein